jgi:hypothetical protein
MTMKHPVLARTLFLASLLACIAPASAQQRGTASTTPPAWEQLPQAERDALIAPLPLRDRWNAADAEQRQRMLHHAHEWRTMTPEQRRTAHKGMKRWSHLSPGQREEARALFEHMRTLPPAERKALRERWHAMTPEQRKAWIEQHPAPPHRPHPPE